VENLCNKLYTCICFLISKIKGESGVTEQRNNERIQFWYAVKNQNITIYTQNNQKEISTDGAI
jgi:hypothetical protein